MASKLLPVVRFTMEFSGDRRVFKGKSGIYMIVCLVTGKIYIGSSYDLGYRYTQHLSGLRRGRHHSPHLQRSWQKHGSDQFLFHVLEQCPVDKLLIREQWYLNEFEPYKTDKGFNNCPIAGRQSGMKMSEEAKEKLRQIALRRLLPSEESKEKLKEAWKENHAKWTQDSIDRRGVEFDIKSPSGEIVRVRGLKRFAKEHGLDHSQLKRLRDGGHREVKGWTLPHIELPKDRVIIDPLGNEISIPRKQTKTFCHERKLNSCMIYQVLRGVRVEHRGWTLPVKIAA